MSGVSKGVGGGQTETRVAMPEGTGAVHGSREAPLPGKSWGRGL